MKLKTIEVAHSIEALQQVLSQELSAPMIITREGKPVAALLPTPNSDIESISLSLDPQFIALIQESRLSLAKEGGISADEMDALFADDLVAKDEKTA
jgi:hypothetical protein